MWRPRLRWASWWAGSRADGAEDHAVIWGCGGGVGVGVGANDYLARADFRAAARGVPAGGDHGLSVPASVWRTAATKPWRQRQPDRPSPGSSQLLLRLEMRRASSALSPEIRAPRSRRRSTRSRHRWSRFSLCGHHRPNSRRNRSPFNRRPGQPRSRGQSRPRRCRLRAGRVARSRGACLRRSPVPLPPSPPVELSSYAAHIRS